MDVIYDKETMKRPIKVWGKNIIDANTIEQAKLVNALPFIHKHVSLMPDAHLGKGSTVGSVIATKKAIIPATVGVDIGCGMVAVKTDLVANQLPTNLKGVRSAIEAAVPVSFKHHDGSNLPPVIKEAWEAANGLGQQWYDTIKNLTGDDKIPAGQLGTLGGGNHFIEICLDENDNVWIMLHSGSRGIGNLIGRTYIEKAKADMRLYHIDLPDQDLAYLPEGTQNFNDYWTAVKWAQDFAAVNRKMMLGLVTDAITKELGKEVRHLDAAVNCHHNYISLENHFGENVYVTRKGAIRARKDDLGIIPSSMGQPSYIVKGKGNKESFTSCSHGAGRRFSRTEAKRRFTVADHEAATKGVECRKDEDIVDETPAAYKNMDTVMEAQKDLVDIQHALKAVVCVKG